MEIHDSQLKDVCYSVARNTMWDMKPVDVSQIQKHGDELFKIAMKHAQILKECGEDPNVVLRAIHYLEQTHAIPPMGDDTRWFDNMLEALIELACPNCVLDNRGVAFLDDVKKGIQEHYKNRGK